MEQITPAPTAIASVDYLGHTYAWDENDLICTHKEITRQLADVQKKIRAETMKQPEKKDVKEKPLRIGNAVGAVALGNELVEPKSLNWQKECDVLWLFGPVYQSENSFEDDDDKTLVGDSTPSTPMSMSYPPSLACSPTASSPMELATTIDNTRLGLATPYPIKPALKKPVEHSPIDDLLAYYACSILNSSRLNRVARRHTLPRDNITQVTQKKSLRFNLDQVQVHYTPTHYSVQSARNSGRSVFPPRLTSNSQITTLGKEKPIVGKCDDFNQIFQWAKSQVETTGHFTLFDNEKRIVRGKSSSQSTKKTRTVPVKNVKVQGKTPSAKTERSPVKTERSSIKTERSTVKAERPSVSESFLNNVVSDNVVSKATNLAANVADVMSWASSMIWDTTIY
ncbi:1537_t:CDS:2 [Paraglomus brasilianum]|uniref:1537_t:CDS:1 n=1 Tax=Paraglomus brasilianum TaxID=144538 RepID=A0A9N8ZG96_9GLOM|nr:1537_t:CDS:2 [Paraglomus brasilianum]